MAQRRFNGAGKDLLCMGAGWGWGVLKGWGRKRRRWVCRGGRKGGVAFAVFNFGYGFEISIRQG